MDTAEAVSRVRARLFALRDLAYRDFQCRLMPTVAPEAVIGVRTPAMRKLARELAGTPEAAAFIRELPHTYYEENNLHSALISRIADFDSSLAAVERFLPHIDNWATCDGLSPAVFKKHRPELLGRIRVWLCSPLPYTVRFAVGMLMAHFLDEDFDPACLALAAGISSEEYYVNMMRAWYYATALAKQYDAALPYLTERRLDVWTHNKTIRKAIESYRITDGQKERLRALTIRQRASDTCPQA